MYNLVGGSGRVGSWQLASAVGRVGSGRVHASMGRVRPGHEIVTHGQLWHTVATRDNFLA